MLATASAQEFGKMIDAAAIRDSKAKREAAQALQRAIKSGVRYLVLYAKNTRIGDSIQAARYGYGEAYTLDRLHETHGLVAYQEFSGEGEDTDVLDAIFVSMQAENWSPNGEARDMIELAGVTHTSMMVGDIVYDTLLDIAWECGDGCIWHIILPERYTRMIQKELAQ